MLHERFLVGNSVKFLLLIVSGLATAPEMDTVQLSTFTSATLFNLVFRTKRGGD